MINSTYLDLLGTRPVIFDGAMGTSIQARDPSPAAFGGEHLAGCNDHLVLSSPELIRDIHASFLEVGCDVVETNTFRANPFALTEYGLQEQTEDLNRTAAALARVVAEDYATPRHPRFVAGSVGPSGFLPSTSDPELGAVTYHELARGYARQARGLLAGGVDLLLVETAQDILEARAAVRGARLAMEESGRTVPLQVQVTLDTSGRMLLGTDILSAVVTLEALNVEVLGLNCSTGPEHMREPIRLMALHARTPISVLPNAGIPHNEGGDPVYPLTPEALAEALGEFVRGLGVAVVGGCCGTTPEHLEAVVSDLARGGRSRFVAAGGTRSEGFGANGGRRLGLGEGTEPTGKSPRPAAPPPSTPRVSSAVRAVDLRQSPGPTIIGERVNAQGSRLAKELLLAEDYQGILQIARDQVEGGAHLLDVCVALSERRDEANQMGQVVSVLSQGVEAPLVVDTTEVDVAAEALSRIPGRAVLNSIHLEGGRGKIDRLLPHVVEHGAAVIALTIDEEGMARTADRKLRVAERIREICVGEYGLDEGSLIFDPLTFTLATGEEVYRASAMETLEAIRRIRLEMPGVLTSLGVSNVSFGLDPQARRVVNAVFLHHAVEAGLDLAILNPGHLIPWDEIPPENRKVAEDLVLNAHPEALANLIAHFQGRETAPETRESPMEGMTSAEAIRWMILHRKGGGIEARVDAEVETRGGGHSGAVATLNQVLLPAMKEVGDRFGAGDLILPFVLQSAEVMKAAVNRLERYLEQVEGRSKGTVVLATVLGDVHDIGKNLVRTILVNNGYTVHDLGKQVPVNTILERARELEADAIGLSALLVSTSRQMPLCIQELHRQGLEVPVLLGGAAINPTFVRAAARVAEDGTLHLGGVFYCRDAFDALGVLEKLLDRDERKGFLKDWERGVRERDAERETLRAKAAQRASRSTRSAPARQPAVPEAPFLGTRVLHRIPIGELVPLVDRNTLYRLHWGARNAGGAALDRLIREEFEPRFLRYSQQVLAGALARVQGAYGFFPAAAEGEELVIFRPERPEEEFGRFSFPRQRGRERLSLADFFLPFGNDTGPSRDVVGLQVVTVGGRILEETAAMMGDGAYSEGYFLHGFGVRLAEAGAEFLHRKIRGELGIREGQGLRYSWGYGVCPDTLQHQLVFRLLPCREKLGMELTEAGALVPELSTAALVVHHPEARYFHV